ncbi:plastocyanin/azurin family copper-binding protein [Aquibacillus salsiterrae]|uniref:Plastocyanin/azurin family copper-binding protein n=1 Tax=Aquibacillus salsiterrae TaxID=2950439 RepID=A0A9X3WID2_9BACI|nr:plastocyanin/azurin family copper-binding protein [Aquibacillus salsiterrae]MDC3417586.1 plastocyanin/azurin family copper-binding protein [Aquibacillus salsiterrae]
MGRSLSFILIILLILSVTVIGKTVYHRKRIPCMTGMMIAMTMGMSVGLTVGVIFGILFSGNLFIATVLGMVIGIVVGFISGVPVSIMAVLDGLLSGAMGGMMGAMLGDMIIPEYRDAITKIMFFLSLSTILILLYLFQKERKSSQAFLFNSPLLLVILFGSIFLLINQMGPIYSETDTPNNNQLDFTTNQQRLSIKSDVFSFSPSTIKIEVNKEVILTLENPDNIEHDLEIENFKGESSSIDSSSHLHNQSNNTIHLHAAPGKQQSVTLTATEPGIYRFICTIPGHKESGMVGTIEVT